MARCWRAVLMRGLYYAAHLVYLADALNEGFLVGVREFKRTWRTDRRNARRSMRRYLKQFEEADRG